MTETHQEEIARLVAKLPRAIRAYIHKIESDLEDYKQQARVVSGETESPIWIGWEHEAHKQYLPPSTTLTFRTDKGTITIHLHKQGKDPMSLQLYGDNRLYIMACASNVISVNVEEP